MKNYPLSTMTVESLVMINVLVLLEDLGDPEKFGPWMRFDEQVDISPPKSTATRGTSSKEDKTCRNLEADLELTAQEK